MRWIVVLVIDGLLALPRLAYTLAVYFWMRVLGVRQIPRRSGAARSAGHGSRC